jgi:hypothetical protein
MGSTNNINATIIPGKIKKCLRLKRRQITDCKKRLLHVYQEAAYLQSIGCLRFRSRDFRALSEMIVLLILVVDPMFFAPFCAQNYTLSFGYLKILVISKFGYLKIFMLFKSNLRPSYVRTLLI